MSKQKIIEFLNKIKPKLNKIIPKSTKSITLCFTLMLIIFLVVFITILNNKINMTIKTTISDKDKEIITLANNNALNLQNEETYIISEGGKYLLTGEYYNSTIHINGKKQEIYLILNNVSITNANNSPCILVENAKKVYIYTYNNSQNSLISNCSDYIYTDNIDEVARGTIYSKDDLTINGNGLLNVINHTSDGIVCNDILTVCNVNLDIKAESDGLNANDGFQTENSTINIIANKDGIHSVNNDSLKRNYTSILSGCINIKSKADGIDSSGNLGIANGSITITSTATTIYSNSTCGLKANNNIIITGGNINIETIDDAMKSDTNIYIENANLNIQGNRALKADLDIIIFSGDIILKATDDGINCGNSFELQGGNLEITSEAEGIHSDFAVKIKNGNLNIIQSKEGIEAVEITISGATTQIKAYDDGINVNCQPNELMKDEEVIDPTVSKNGFLKITDGIVYVSCSGDGLDSNDKIEITGGIIIVNGPISSSNGALDYDTTCKVKGGVLIATGSTQMAKAPTSGQCSLLINFTSSITKETTLIITDNNNKPVFAFTTDKSYSSIVISIPTLKKGNKYNVYTNSNVAGENIFGYYDNPTVNSNGSLYKSYTHSEKVTTLGKAHTMPMPGGRP